jgi:tRNA-2-methylthio-N6-dimethylallyladenosine synthase
MDTVEYGDTGVMMTAKKLFINTMGCQMNVYDSDQIRSRLAPMGYDPTDDLNLADVIIVNTCTIRDKAEQKAFSFLGRLAPLKARRPHIIIGIGGCVAQQEGRRILKRMPHVDLVFGTHAIGRLPKLIRRIDRTRCRLVDIDIAETIAAHDFSTDPYPKTDVSAFVTIMRGCDNYCTYCIVPYVRGRESSRNPQDILTEIGRLVDQGVREVTLLGQNVNSYGKKEGLGSFSQLLELVAGIDGLQRIRFTTSHPKDLSMELIQCFKHLDKLCRHIHLPVQSGSAAVLKRMNRRYTPERYLEKVAQLREVSPEIAITSDIIVGFPGETDADFEATLSLIDQVKFDGLFAFVYSDRLNAPAARFSDKIDMSVKKERLQRVLDRQKAFTMAKHQSLVGTVQEILVDGNSKHRADTDEDNRSGSKHGGIQWSGRTTTNKIVHFIEDAALKAANQMLTGKLMRIMIEEAMPHCLWGRPIAFKRCANPACKGDNSYAA